MSTNNNSLAGKRNSTPESQNLRPLASARQALRSELPLRASADMTSFNKAPTRTIRPASEVYYGAGGANGAASNQTADEIDRATQQWLADIDQYEATLEEMVTATLDQDFKDELSAIEQWFKVLSEAERTAALYALLQQTTQVQIRFFIQVLQEMAQSHPISGLLSPSSFGQNDPIVQKASEAMNRLTAQGTRHSLAGSFARSTVSSNPKHSSGVLEPSVISTMFPDAVNAIAKQKEQFTQTTGMTPSTRNSMIIGGDRSSVIDRNSMLERNSVLLAPQEDKQRETHWKSLSQDSQASQQQQHQSQQSQTNFQHQAQSQPLPTPQSQSFHQKQHQLYPQQKQISRPKSATNQQAQFSQPATGSAIPLSPHYPGTMSNSNVNNLVTMSNIPTLNAPIEHKAPWSPFHESWASASATPQVANFSQIHALNNSNADMIANATAMKLAALSTFNNGNNNSNRIQLDDPKKFRRQQSKSNDGTNNLIPMTPGLPINFMDENGNILTAQQAAAINQLNALQNQTHRSRPNSPGIMLTNNAPFGAFAMPSPQNAQFLTSLGGAVPLSPGLPFGMPMSLPMDDDRHGQRGRSPRGGNRRGSSKPPEDPTDVALLRDIPNWLRAQRLHKYTDQLQKYKWEDMIKLTEDQLEKDGVSAKGARTKLLKAFAQVNEAIAEGKLSAE